MEPDQLIAGTTVCPSCGASLRPDAPWCTLCYAHPRAAVPDLEHPAGSNELGAGEQAPPATSWPCRLPLALASVLLTGPAPHPHGAVLPGTPVASVPAAR